MKTINYFGQDIEVSDEVAAFLEADRKKEDAQGRSDRRHLSKRAETVSSGGRVSEFWDPTFDAVARKLRNEALYAAIDKLSNRDREVIELYFWERLTMQEIADCLGVSRMAISKRLKKIYRQLRESM